MKIKFLLLILPICFITSCDQKPVMRVYEEINSAPPVDLNKPKNSMLPEGHPQLSEGQGDLPPGHPNISGEKSELPPGHPPIDGGMGMMSNDPQMQAMLQSSVSSLPLKWETPKLWSEEKGSGMRLVTFKSRETDPVTCTIVMLGGMAGGLESNIVRWAKQINLNEENVTGKKLQDFIQKQDNLTSKGGLKIQIIDLTMFSDAKDKSAQSILGGIMEQKDTTIFIKMTGSLQAIQNNREPFKSLCISLSINK